MGRKLLKIFDNEIKKINDESLKRAVKDILILCDDKNAVGAASSSGKYHPQFSLGEGGLIRHTKAVCLFVERILSMMPQYDNKEAWDIPYCAAILHDMCKYIKGQEYTEMQHPLIMGKMIREYAKEKFANFDNLIEGDYTKMLLVADAVECHMSRWHTDKKTGKPLGIPPTKMEHYIVAIADMISATRNIKIDFDENNNIN